MESENIRQTNKFEQLYKVTSLSKYLAMILFVSMPFLGGWIGYVYAPAKIIETTVSSIESIETEAVETKFDLRNIFNLDNKESGTKVFYSEKQGVGFSYLPLYNNELRLVEIEDSIFYLDRNGSHKIMEIFTKEQGISLADTIRNKFIIEAGLNLDDCEVEIRESHVGDKNYKIGQIYSPDRVSLVESPSCESNYATHASLQYFLYNEEVPNKYVFVRVGQDTFATDGTPESTARTSWEYSTQILE